MVEKKSKKKKQTSPEPLEAIKRLLIALLLTKGASSEDIGEILEVDSSTIRHLIPVKKFRKKTDGEKA